MAAGDSTREVARKTAEAAEVLQKKADSAARKSAAFAQGAEGEVTLSKTLAPLAAKGWLTLSDRKLPHGGNVDQILVGPAGVAVIDAKNWTYAVELKGEDVFTGRFRRSNHVDGVIKQVEIVNAALADVGVQAEVRGFLALVGELDRGRNCKILRGVGIVGVDHIVEEFLKMEVQFTTANVEEVFRAMSLAFPPMSTTASRAEPAQYVPLRVRKLFDKNARFFYIHRWKKAGKDRLYLKAPDGSDLGWKNVNTGKVEVTCKGDDATLVRAVLDSATPRGVTLAAENLPKIALNFPGGKLLAKLSSLGAPVLVGQEWRSNGVHRLYGKLIFPNDATLDLGYVDLETGVLNPAVDGKLGKDYGPAVNYLQLLAERRPIIQGKSE